MEKFKNKYRLDSMRADFWDYNNTGVYFVTICTKDRYHFFGEIKEQHKITCQIENSSTQEKLKTIRPGKEELKIKCSKAVEACWQQIPSQFPFASIGPFVVMPNHVHGILIISQHSYPNKRYMKNNPAQEIPLKENCQSKNRLSEVNNPMLYDGLGKVVRWFKGRCTYDIRKLNPNFSWQTLYHDRIIKNELEYHSAEIYIQNNPKKWLETNQ
jgi:REP element-mobilizing transposase RayT